MNIRDMSTRDIVCNTIIGALCLFVVAPLTWTVMDRDPPERRLYGTITSYDDPDRQPRQGEQFSVEWKTTAATRSCPGTVQVEVIDAERNIWIKPMRTALKAVPGQSALIPRPWTLSSNAAPGPAIYRVTTMWYCTWLQKLFDWPVVQVGPDINFTILPKDKNQ